MMMNKSYWLSRSISWSSDLLTAFITMANPFNKDSSGGGAPDLDPEMIERTLMNKQQCLLYKIPPQVHTTFLDLKILYVAWAWKQETCIIGKVQTYTKKSNMIKVAVRFSSLTYGSATLHSTVFMAALVSQDAVIKFLIQTKAAGWKANDWNLKNPDWRGKMRLVSIV